MKKKFGIVLATAICGALSVGVAPRASALGTVYTISTQADWATVFAGDIVNLSNGDTLDILPGSGSPNAGVIVQIGPNANVTINGGGEMRTGVCILQHSNTTTAHTVTIKDLQITAPLNLPAYLEYNGTINLVGTNVLAGSMNYVTVEVNSSGGSGAMGITSSTGGTLTVSSDNTSSRTSLSAKKLSIQGNARVTVDANGNGWAVYAESALTVDSGASLIATATGSSAIAGWNLVVTNNGTLTASGRTTGDPVLSGLSTINMGGGASTSITGSFPETHYFVRIPASGYQWQVSGGASLEPPSTVASEWAYITIAASATGVVKQVAVAPPTSPALPMLRFTESPDMTGDGFGDTLAVDSGGYLWVFPGSSTGQFGSPVSRIGSGFTNLLIAAPGDVNSDGRADVLAIDNDGTLWLYAGNGTKQLSTRKQVGNGWTGWRLIPAGDLSGDKKADLLGIDSNGDLYMYAGKGDGTFGMKKKVGNGWNGWELFSAGDLNGDGKTDILGINSVGDLYQYAGKGDGTFQMKVKAGNGWIGYTLAAGADLNGDGKADILGLDQTTHILYVYLGKGNAQFAMKKAIATGW